MDLDPDVCYRALQTRDVRFDGRFFTAVRTTGVYCRPICPAPTPRRENCRFLPCAAAAQAAGFRPCLRCRPEASPGTPAWLGTSATVSRALRLIADGALDHAGVGALADRLGIGERHLRRLFLEHVGASPLAVAQTRRLLFAKQLLDETRLPVSQIALAAGFSSIRRFNAAVREAWGRTPSALRREVRAEPRPGGALSLRLGYRPPLDWDALLAYFALRAIPGVECVEDGRYRRSIAPGGVHGVVEVEPAASGHYLVARIRLERPAPLAGVVERLRRLFDLGADPAVIGDHLGADRRLAARLRALPGVRVPGAWDGFETAVRIVLGQQVSVAAASVLTGRVAAAYGEPLSPDLGDASLDRVFPQPAALRRASAARLRVPGARAAALRHLARAAHTGAVSLDAAPDLETAVAALEALPGIGPWTAQTIAMRCLHEPDAFPTGDLGLRKALGRSGRLATPAAVAAAAEPWRPWRAYAAALLWSRPA